MKLLFVICALCGVALTAIVGGIMIANHCRTASTPTSTQQIFTARGKVLQFDADGKTVQIAHEEIPGFMPAMTMPFTIRDTNGWSGIAVGDQVEFQLVVTRDDSWVSTVRKLQQTNTPALDPSTVRLRVEGGSNGSAASLRVGELVPDFRLVNQDNQSFRLSDFRGKAVVLTFIYTRCPLPNYCPLMTKNFAELQARFAKEFPGRVQLLSISFDPDFDGPTVLKQYARLATRNEAYWAFATGSREQTGFVADLFGVHREPANGTITHDLRTGLIGPDGHLVHVWKSNVWTPYEVQRMVRETLTPAVANR